MDSIEFGKLIRDRRRAAGLKQSDLAMAISTAPRFIVDLEAGKATSQLGKALAAAAAVGISVVPSDELAELRRKAMNFDNGSDPVAPEVETWSQLPGSKP